MKNSEVLYPAAPESSPFTFVNYASWNIGLARFVARQMPRSAFRGFVIGNLSASRIGALPGFQVSGFYQHLRRVGLKRARPGPVT